MKITKFKTLIYMDNYVDVSKLNSGIYSSIKPTLYSSDESIGNIVKNLINNSPIMDF